MSFVGCTPIRMDPSFIAQGLDLLPTPSFRAEQADAFFFRVRFLRTRRPVQR
jgi:hypothetical protein